MLILHGENLVAGRKRLIEQIGSFKTKSNSEVIRLEGNSLALAQLKQALESRSLFGADRLVVIEGLFAKPASKEKEAILAYLKKTSPANLLVWEAKTVDGRTLNSFSGAKEVEKFSLSPQIFKFLDSLASGNPKTSLLLFHQCLVQDPPEMIFYMLSRQVRFLLIAKDLGKEGLTKMADWQKVKLARQAERFSPEQLLIAYQKLLLIDQQEKTGQGHFPLASQLDLWLASL